MKNIGFEKVTITDGFWAERQHVNRTRSLDIIYNRFKQTGRFAAIDCNKDVAVRPHVFWDSDTAKWLESAAYALQKKRDAQLEEKCDDLIERLVKNQRNDGYFNSYFAVFEPESVFYKRFDHELYCLGHLIEAAVAYVAATNKSAFLGFVMRYADYVYDRFYVKKDTPFTTPGHAEVEMALVKLFRFTKEKRYLDLALFFVDERGKRHETTYDFTHNDYDQSHKPVREQDEAVGHCVRALYLYCAMADLAEETGDATLRTACERLYADLTQKKMYVTGAFGSTYHGEAFTQSYDLPSNSAYAETCASIAFIFFAQRMANLCGGKKYQDDIERALYNGVLAGESLDGTSFFYVNPLGADVGAFDMNESRKTKLNMPILQRKEVFDCSCCPPNLTRLILSLGSLAFSEDGDTVQVNQYFSASAELSGGGKIEVDSGFPYKGAVSVRVIGKAKTVMLRVPDWAQSFRLSKNGKSVAVVQKDGYVSLGAQDGDCIEIDFALYVLAQYPNAQIRDTAGRIAVRFGPLIYCAEGTDNPELILPQVRLAIPMQTKMQNIWIDDVRLCAITLNGEVPVLGNDLYSFSAHEKKAVEVKLIPYFAWANRGKNDMQVFFLTK